MNNNHKTLILKKYTYLLIGVFLFGNTWGQESTNAIKNDSLSSALVKELWDGTELTSCIFGEYPKTLNALMIGAGSSNMYDTYLSPLKYTGFSLRVMDERMRETTWFGGRFRKQQIIELEFSSGQNPAKNVREYWGKIRYQLGGHYRFYQNQSLMLSAGGFWDITAGGLYNERNGNNPATGRAYTNLNLSAMASYKWKKYAIRWQVDMPFMGMLFSPKYGQSYYEISLGNTVGIVNFASFHNQRALRNFVTVDIPISSYLVRVGYLGDWYQTKVNSIQTHHYTHSFVLGFPLEGVKKPRQKTSNTYWN